MIFVDTNYFLRYLFHDVSDQQEVVKQLFLKGVEGKVSLVTSTIVFFEIYWVLFSVYKKDKSELVKILLTILQLSFIQLAEREILQNSVLLFSKESLDLEDCYNMYFAKSQKISAENFKTFDKKLQKVFLLEP